jgi:hypothetical protein
VHQRPARVAFACPCLEGLTRNLQDFFGENDPARRHAQGCDAQHCFLSLRGTKLSPPRHQEMRLKAKALNRSKQSERRESRIAFSVSSARPSSPKSVTSCQILDFLALDFVVPLCLGGKNLRHWGQSREDGVPDFGGPIGMGTPVESRPKRSCHTLQFACSSTLKLAVTSVRKPGSPCSLSLRWASTSRPWGRFRRGANRV